MEIRIIPVRHCPSDYRHAQTAQCMDYLSISEHNHFSSVDNPGNVISINYHLGPVQANNFFPCSRVLLCMYGVGGGWLGSDHVVVW